MYNNSRWRNRRKAPDELEAGLSKIEISSLHTILFSYHWQACRHFYQNILGFKECCERDGFVEYEINKGSRIGLIRTTKRKKDRLVLSLCVPDIQLTRENLQSDIPDLSEVKAHKWDAWVMECRDPDGRRVEFWSRR